MTERTLDPNDPRLLCKILLLFQARIVGEARNILALFQALVGSLSGRAFLIVVKGQSAAGKSRLARSVLAPFIRLGLVMEFSRLTGAYLEYLGSRQVKAAEEDVGKKDVFEMDLSTPILYIDELRGARESLQSLKIIYSEGRFKLGTVVKGRSVDVILKGLKVILSTTTNASFQDSEFENRLLPLQIDETEPQTGKILDYQGEEGESLEEEDEQDQVWLASPEIEAICNFIKALKPVKVSIPYARELSRRYPRRDIRARREFPKVKRIIRNITTIFQAQRTSIRSKGKLVAGIASDPADLEYANWIGLPALSESLSGLSGKEKEILEILKLDGQDTGVDDGLVGERKVSKGWTVQQILSRVGLSRRKEDAVRKFLKRMMEDGYVQEDQSEKAFRYSWTGLEPASLELKLEERSGLGLASWAETRGYEISELKPLSEFVEPSTINKEMILSDVEPGPSQPNKIEQNRVSETQPELVVTGETQRRLDPTHTVDLLAAERLLSIRCPSCRFTFPDQSSFDNHLSTYKHV